ncbi:MAG: DSD1 family PLP-dependent enzyme [Gemmatimonadetes bacterium]|mgnify:FL=1|nr:DSD1 family PLP-dependent enzyme [Gemmatimonadota bacterium]MEE2846913.1 DSD1 family PLP-dependent enzyme [Gemmatimonadota bacterium]
MRDSSLSRRRFLQSAGAAAVAVPTSIKGFTAAEMRGFDATDVMEADISKWELDTPALCVDLDALEANLATLQQTVVRNGIASRPHAKTHKCPAIARLQIENGSVGICTAKVGEAVAMYEHGIDEILMTTINATLFKITRAMNLRRQCSGFIQATDTPGNARDLSAAAEALGIVADVVVDIDSGGHRTGVTPGQPALELAQLVDQLPGLRLQGMLCYDGGSQHVKGFDTRRARTLERLVPATETYDLMQRSGLNTGIFSGGGTGTYNIDHETRGLTDIQVGSYVFMDAQYLAIGGSGSDLYSDFDTSLTILTTVLNAQYEGRVTTDAGAKACTINQPWPIVKGETGMSYTSGSDEFGTLRYDDPSRTYKLGDKLELIVSHCDPVVNLYDQMYAVRNDRVEAVWRIAARGMSA